MKRLRISKLMDEYTDTEVFPEGGSTADPEAVKRWVLSHAERPVKKLAPQKKSMPRKKKLWLAAALAAVMVVLVGAGFPYMQHRLASGVLSFEQSENERITALVHYAPLVQEEDGRLWFTPDEGERMDITDLVSEETPYIYDGSDPETEKTYYVIMGGTPEFYGYFEWIMTPDPFDHSNDNGVEFITGTEEGMYTVYGYSMNGPNREDDVGGMGTGPVYWDDALDHPWLRAGLEKLDIPVTIERNYTVITEE